MLAYEKANCIIRFKIWPFRALICCNFSPNPACFSGPTSSARQKRARLKAPAGSLLISREGKMKSPLGVFNKKASLSVNKQGRTRIPPLLALKLVSLLLEINVVYGKQQRFNASLCLLSSPRVRRSESSFIISRLCFTTLFSVLVHITVTRSIGQQ